MPIIQLHGVSGQQVLLSLPPSRGTQLSKPFAIAIEGLAWVSSSQERKAVYGFSLVLLVWMNGTLGILLGPRLWRTGGPSKDELALELPNFARATPLLLAFIAAAAQFAGCAAGLLYCLPNRNAGVDASNMRDIDA